MTLLSKILFNKVPKNSCTFQEYVSSCKRFLKDRVINYVNDYIKENIGEDNLNTFDLNEIVLFQRIAFNDITDMASFRTRNTSQLVYYTLEDYLGKHGADLIKCYRNAEYIYFMELGDYYRFFFSEDKVDNPTKNC